ncbi:unnamed protein product, partial [Allacma fusca]
YKYVPIFIADSPARCAVQGLIQYNGKYGCPWCLIRGETYWFGEERRCRKWVFKYQQCVDRTQSQFLEDLETFSNKLDLQNFKDDSFNGIKSASQLLLLNKFDIVKGFTYDVMHSAYLGVVKMFTAFWFDSSNHEQIFYIGSQTQSVNKKLLQFRIPCDYDRTIRSITLRKFWKATESRTWMFVATTALKGILSEVHRQHFLKLSNCIMLLSDEKNTTEDLILCEENLSLFVQQTENLYGMESCILICIFSDMQHHV